MDDAAAQGPARDRSEYEAELARGQVEIVRDNLDDEVGVGFADDVDDGERSTRDPADFAYLYRDRHVLVRDRDLQAVRDEVPGAELDDSLVVGVSRVRLPDDRDFGGTLRQLEGRLGRGAVTPDHVLWVTPRITCCPATEPELPVSGVPVPGVYQNPTAGHGVKVSVVDTGWHPPSATDPTSPWLSGVTGGGGQQDVEDYDPQHLRPYQGHGTFIAGVIRCQAPAAEVTVEGFLPRGGAVFESEIITQLTESLQHAPDIINLSAGGTTRKNHPLLAFEVWHKEFLSKARNTVLVASAGNNGVRTSFYPAASPWAISVGALDTDGKRAEFSNFGPTVDVYALGVDLVNAYPRGTYAYVEPPNLDRQPETFDGLCSWSGTSFSAPVVTGMIARRMSKTGLSARHAAKQLLREARAHAVPGVGPVL